MKSKSLGLVLLSLSISVYSANYQQFITPDSLGKNVNTLNKTYQLGLKKDPEQSSQDPAITYSNSEKSPCNLLVATNKAGSIEKITVHNSAQCTFKTTKPVNYDLRKTTTKDILNQVKLNEARFNVGCFNCPSRIEIFDTLTINRPIDTYWTEFEIQGYNSEFHKALAKLLIDKGINEDNYYEYMDKLDTLMGEKPSLYDREDVKKLALKSYDLSETTISYTLNKKFK